MSTIGHPLSDLTNLLNPWTTAESEHAARIGRQNLKFQRGACPGLPTKDDCIQWYQDVAGYDPRPDMIWGEAFGIYRGCVIVQGIAARYALRQASSTRAKEYGEHMKPYAELAWELIQDYKREHKANL